MEPNAPPAATSHLIDFATSPLPEYASFFAMIIDHAFTPSECLDLLRLAEATPGETWSPASINVGRGRQEIVTDVRNCGRIIRDDHEAADRIFERVRRFVEREGADVVGTGEGIRWPAASSYGMGRGEWKMKRLNERLRFLKYGPEEYFRIHCDGQYRSPDDSERSFLTLQLYLGSSPDLRGGATRFWSHSMKKFIDVEPLQGRVLIFQHKNLLHSGEEILNGEKITVRTDFMYERAESSAS